MGEGDEDLAEARDPGLVQSQGRCWCRRWWPPGCFWKILLMLRWIVGPINPCSDAGTRVARCTTACSSQASDGGHELGVFSGAGNVTCVKR